MQAIHSYVYVRNKVHSYPGHQELIVSVVKRRKLSGLDMYNVMTSPRQSFREQLRMDRRRRESWNGVTTESTGCSLCTLVHGAVDRDWLRALITDASVVTPQRPTSRVMRRDKMTRASHC